MATHFSGPIVSDNGFNGITFQGGSGVAITEDGAIPVTNLFSLVWPDGSDGSAATALTLADGEAGQMKIIKYGDGTVTTDVVITPANLADGNSITLDAAGDTVILVFDGTNWQILYNDGTVGTASEF